MDTLAWMPTAGLSRIHMDPENPVPGIGEGGLVGELSDEAIDAFVGLAGPDSGSPLLLTELRQLGGAIGRPAENAGALEKLDADYVMYSVGMPMTPELGEAIPAYLDKIGETMRPFGADGGYFNFAEAPCDVDAIMPADVCDRLRAVKREWDPRGAHRRQPRGRCGRGLAAAVPILSRAAEAPLLVWIFSALLTRPNGSRWPWSRAVGGAGSGSRSPRPSPSTSSPGCGWSGRSRSC